MATLKPRLFDWEHEPAQERAAFGSTTTFGALGATPSSYRVRELTSADKRAAEDPALLREPPKQSDLELSSLARGWEASLPPPIRPKELFARFPRIANRIALCWPDRALTESIFTSLFSVKRPGRRGFPREILAELTYLRKFSDDASNSRSRRVG